MRAAVLHKGRIVVRDDVPEPVPALGQVLVQVKACGICGSDLHFARHGRRMLELGRQMQGMPDLGVPEVDLDSDLYLGHEFSAEVLEVGPGTEALPPGTVVTSLPVLMSMDGVSPIMYSNDVLGGYGERMLLTAPLLLEVPNGLDPRHAALTEPMAVGVHAVNRSGIERPQGALVLGCGPVGLAVVAALAQRGIEPVVASDFSPTRRALASRMGAHAVVDPAGEDAFDAWRRVGGTRPLVVFEAVGVPGMIDGALRDAPPQSSVVVVGVCMERDAITPFWAIAKELSLQFVFGYDPMEFADTLRAIAEGELDVAPLVTREVDLDGVAGAFEALADPDDQCKILVTP